MMGYTKLFNELIMSTVWREPDPVRILWITMLAMKDRWHVVNASLPGLADAAKISLQDCEKALEVLSSPDPYSRTEEHEGRRIEKCEGGWLILNGEKYRNKMSLEERREYQRIKQKEYRDRKKSVKSCLQSSQQITHTETDTYSDTDTKKKKQQFSPPSQQEVIDYFLENGYSQDAAIRAFNGYQAADWHDSTGKKVRNWKQKMIHVWFKPENKAGASNGRPSKIDEALESVERYRPV